MPPTEKTYGRHINDPLTPTEQREIDAIPRGVPMDHRDWVPSGRDWVKNPITQEEFDQARARVTKREQKMFKMLKVPTVFPSDD